MQHVLCCFSDERKIHSLQPQGRKTKVTKYMISTQSMGKKRVHPPFKPFHCMCDIGHIKQILVLSYCPNLVV